MTRLLVSVRDRHEARSAVAGGASIIDVKDPSRGSLGAASPQNIRGVLDELGGRVLVSAALGELIELDETAVTALAPDLAFAKLGLAGCATLADWPARWRRWASQLPAVTAAVAVVYADHHAAHSPPAEAIIEVAAAAGSPILLVDTFDKSRGRLFDHWSLDRLAEVMASARDAGMAIAVAGSLDAAAIDRLLPLGPEIVAVRGAACAAGRTSAISTARVASLAERLAAVSL